MIPRLYVDAPLAERTALALAATQAHYVRNVMRRGAGDALKLFNARDGEFAAVISRADKKGVEVRLNERLRAPAPESDIWLLFAPVKRDAMELVVQKATELGAARLIPVETERTQKHRVNDDRLAAVAIEAAEQCGRLSVPVVELLRPLASALEAWPKERNLIYCDEAGDDPALEWGGGEGRAPPLLKAVTGLTPPVAVLIGPEGGFAPQERLRLRALPFVTPVSLGPRILRADTAAIVSFALLQAALGDWR